MVVDDFSFDVTFLVRNALVLGLGVPFPGSNLDIVDVHTTNVKLVWFMTDCSLTCGRSVPQLKPP